MVELGVNFVDTADSYGPHVDETLIAEALHPYPRGLVIATKGGLVRPTRHAWDSDGRPEHLRRALEGSLKRLMPYKAHTHKGTVRGKISQSAFEAHKQGRVRVTSARGGNFFRPWGLDSTMSERVFHPLLSGKPAQLTGRSNLPHTHTYVRDFGKALVVLGERDEADGQAWHVPNDQPTMTQGELVRLFAEEAGVAPKMSSMGKMMMSIGGLFIPAARETVEMMYEFEKPFVVDDKKFKQAFGDIATSHREAVRETVAWYREPR